MKKKVLIILGPTASGKSALGVKLAKKYKGEVISADSRQVYKGLNAGTGKITKAEMKSVLHHLLDVADAKKYFSVSEYKSLAEKALQKILQKNKLPIIVGGTGFYIDALTGTVALPEVAPNKLLRKKLEKYSAEKLFKMLQKKDARRAKEIDPNNKVRIIRALEIIDALGRVPEIKNIQSPYEFIYIGLKPSKKELEKKIHKRILVRLEPMIREAKKLYKGGLSFKRMHDLGLEYRSLARLLQKKIYKDEFVRELFVATVKYSKRQETWFKRNKKIKWFEPADAKAVERYLTSKL
jgi:tRNA dimethylallyltransferase